MAQPLPDPLDQQEATEVPHDRLDLLGLLAKPDIQPAIIELKKVQDTTIGNLLGFMHAFNLRFGVATTVKQKQAYQQLFEILDGTRDQILPRPSSTARPRRSHTGPCVPVLPEPGPGTRSAASLQDQTCTGGRRSPGPRSLPTGRRTPQIGTSRTMTGRHAGMLAVLAAMTVVSAGCDAPPPAAAQSPARTSWRPGSRPSRPSSPTRPTSWPTSATTSRTSGSPARAENWPLADFYLGETKSHLRWAVRRIPIRKDNKGRDINLTDILEAFEKSQLATVEADDRRQGRGRLRERSTRRA